MILETQDLYIDFAFQDIKVVANVGQYDKDSRKFIVHFAENGSEIELNEDEFDLRIAMIKPDGNPVLNDVPINDDGTALLVFDENMCTADGVAEMQFILKDKRDDSWLRSFKFKIKVNKAVFDDSTVTPTYEFSALTNLIDKADAAIERINQQHIIVVSQDEPSFTYLKKDDEWLFEY